MTGRMNDIEYLEVDDRPNKEHLAGKAREFVEDLEKSIRSIGRKSNYSSMGVKPNSSFLLYGPPGTGKSLSIRVLNNSINSESHLEEAEMVVGRGIPQELKDKVKESRERGEIDRDGIKKFTYRVGMDLFVAPYDIGRYGTAYINRGPRNMQDFFDNAYDMAESGKKVLLEFDEADALLGSRKGGMRKHSEDKKLMETLMKNMQKARDMPRVFMAFISNIPEECDFASFRTGRIDQKYEFNLPNLEERAEMFQVAVDKRNEMAEHTVVRGYDCQELADMSKGLSYSDIDAAVVNAVRERAKELEEESGDEIVKSGWIKQGRIESQIEKILRQNTSERIGFN